MSGLLSPERRETFLGNAEILEVFNITKVGKVAGCRVTEGKVERGVGVRLVRDNVVIHEGKLKTLKRFKDEVSEVQCRPGMRHGLRKLRRHPRRRHDRMLPRRAHHPHAVRQDRLKHWDGRRNIQSGARTFWPDLTHLGIKQMATRPTSSAPSQRMLRVGEQVRAAITQVLQRGEVRDDLIERTVISISEVRMSPDLKIATAYVTPLGVADHRHVIDALNRNAKFIRGRLGRSFGR